MQKKHKPTTLVVYDTKTNRYKRYEDRVRTNHVQAEFPMSASMVEEFRVDPASILGPDAAGQAMTWLKSLFVPRFSAFDVIAVGVILSMDVSLIVTALLVAAWTVVAVAAERGFDLRSKNGNTPWNEL